MYKILIVDDEKIERNGIKMLLKQLGIECEICEETNGQAALDYLTAHDDIDILLTDVKMPFMDGIELIDNVAKLGKNIKSVIFSGCSEFDYARQAVRLGVSDYILKPVDPKEFSRTLKKVFYELDEAKAESDLMAKSIKYMNEHMLYMLANGSTLEEIKKYNNDLVPLDFIENIKRAMLMEFSEGFFGRNGENFADKVIEAIPEISNYLNLNTNQALFLFDRDDCEFVEVAQKLVAYVKVNYSETCYVAISSEITEPDRLSAYVDELDALMENRFYHKEIHVYYTGMESSEESMIQVDDDTLIKQMKQDVKMKDISSLRNHFARFCDKYSRKSDFSQVYIKFLFGNLLKDFNANIPDSDEKNLDAEIDTLYKATDFAAVMAVAQNSIDRLEKVFDNNPQMLHREIEVVKQYIYDNYEKEISVDSLADMVFMAPSYLSAVFKKETGQNLCKFIKAYRMEKAKELLEDSLLKIVDISNRCGYANVSYFCSSFREYYGVSPQKFRESGEIE